MFPPVEPPPLKLPMVSSIPFKARVAPLTLANVTPLLVLIALDTLSFKVPALIVVKPV